MDLANFEAVVRLTAFVIRLALLAAAEAAVPRRRRAVVRSHRWLGNLGLVLVDTIAVRAAPFLSAVVMAELAETRGWGLLHIIGPVPTWLGIAASIVVLDLAI